MPTDEPPFISAADYLPDCTGDYDCPADVHIHGCMEDVSAARCEAPWEHRQ